VLDLKKHLIRNYQLGKNIQQYGFFAYAVKEALFLSYKEKKVLVGLFENIAAELEGNTDTFSQMYWFPRLSCCSIIVTVFTTGNFLPARHSIMT